MYYNTLLNKSFTSAKEMTGTPRHPTNFYVVAVALVCTIVFIPHVFYVTEILVECLREPSLESLIRAVHGRLKKVS